MTEKENAEQVEPVVEVGGQQYIAVEYLRLRIHQFTKDPNLIHELAELMTAGQRMNESAVNTMAVLISYFLIKAVEGAGAKVKTFGKLQ